MAAGLWSQARFVTAIAIGAILLSASSQAVAASSRICRQLDAELAATYRSGASSAQLRKQDATISRQREQLRLARKRSRQDGCGFSLFGRGEAKCASINTKIEKMERNLDALQRKRSTLSGKGTGTSRARLLAALDANGCRENASAQRRLPRELDSNKSLLDQIFGGTIKNRRTVDDDLGDNVPGRRDTDNGLRVLKPREGNWVNDGGHIRFSAPPGQYRTLCVRTCDGYFFPMSNASGPMDFDRDQKNCESSCPGTDVQLYYHRALGEESEDMIAQGTGAPYSELPTAYLYKQTGAPRPSNCGCNRQRDFKVMVAKPQPGDSAEANTDAESRTTSPSSIVTLGSAEPEANAANVPAPSGAPERDETDGDKKVRVVGPSFLPDPGSAIDLQAPVPTQVQ